GDEQRAAFERVKAVLISKPLLVYPDFQLPFTLVTDASKVELGAVLMQDQGHGLQPVSYASKVASETEANYGITELECLAVVWAIKLNRPYLYGRRFTIVTDHSALKWLMTSPNLAGNLHRWALTLQEFDFEVQYRPGSTNVVADALSRAPVVATVRAAVGRRRRRRRVIRASERKARPPDGGKTTREQVAPDAADSTTNSIVRDTSQTDHKGSDEQDDEDEGGTPNENNTVDVSVDDHIDGDTLRFGTSSDATDLNGAGSGDAMPGETNVAERRNWGTAIDLGDTRSETTQHEDGNMGGISKLDASHETREVQAEYVKASTDDEEQDGDDDANVVKPTATSRPMPQATATSHAAIQEAERLRAVAEARRTAQEPTLQLTDADIVTAQNKSRMVQRLVDAKEYRGKEVRLSFGLAVIETTAGSHVAGPLPTTDGGKRFVVAAVEYVTRYAVAATVKQHTANMVAEFLMRNVVLKFGPFRELLTDGAPELTGHVIEELVELLQAHQKNPVPYRPQMIGLRDWDQWADFAVYAYNSGRHSTVMLTPNKLMIGRRLKSPNELLRATSRDEVADVSEYHNKLVATLEISHKEAERAREREQRRQAKYYGRRVRGKRTFNEGDRVWMFKPPRGPKASKFVHQWLGPLRIVEAAGFDNYLLEREDTEIPEKVIATRLSWCLITILRNSYEKRLRTLRRSWNRRMRSATWSLRRRQKRLPDQRRQPYVQQRRQEARNEVEAQWRTKEWTENRASEWWNYDGDDDVTKQDSMSSSSKYDQYEPALMGRTRRMTGDGGCRYTSTSGDTDSEASWKTPRVGKSCSGYEVAAVTEIRLNNWKMKNEIGNLAHEEILTKSGQAVRSVRG
ncbi:reverse transcriptase, partial [Phytophthora megakarya]